MPIIDVRSAPFTAERVLCFAPHPDDEVLGPGGTLHLHAAGGGDVQVVLATDGIAGDPRKYFDPSTYGERRREESRRGLRRLGCERVEFWGLPDSYVVTESDKLMLIERVVQAIAKSQPDTVYLPWQGDNHSDHLVLHEVVVRGLAACEFPGAAWGYEVWAPISAPDLVVDITEVQGHKAAALACYESQFRYGDLAHQVFGMNAYRSLLLERSGGYGEAFQKVDWRRDAAAFQV